MNRPVTVPKVAIVHDFLWKMGGAERTLSAFLEIFPDAQVFTLFGDKESVDQIISDRKWHTSFLQKFPLIRKYYRYTYFLWPMAIESFDLSEYDIVISSSSSVAKGILPKYNCIHISYMYTPMRYVWDQTFTYFSGKYFGNLKKLAIFPFIHFIRMWDVLSTSRVEYLISISNFVSKRIQKYYGMVPDAMVYPPVDIERAKISKKKSSYYISISPLEPNKGGETLLEYCARYKVKLKIIGKGSLLNKFKRKYKKFKNIQFLGAVSEDEKWDLLSKAKGYLSCGTEEFGISMIEAIASGTPVIAYNDGGAAEIVKEGKTGFLFDTKELKDINRAVRMNQEYIRDGKWNPRSFVRYAKKFSKERFKNEICSSITQAVSRFT